MDFLAEMEQVKVIIIGKFILFLNSLFGLGRNHSMPMILLKDWHGACCRLKVMIPFLLLVF